MERVTVRIVDLLEQLKANRVTHETLYHEARDGYRQQAIELFRKELALAEKGWSFQNSVYLEPPQNHTKDYDNAIQMLEMALKAVEPSVHKEAATITIDRKDFACFVRDDWGWKENWTSNVTGYTIPKR